MEKCCKSELCKGFSFKQKYKPVQSIVGNKDAPILIIGLNPKTPKDEDDHYIDGFSAKELEHYFDNVTEKHNYFGRFKKVSDKLFSSLGKKDGVAHTDIIKCYSKTFPPGNCKSKDIEIIIDNCKGYLVKQLEKHPPKIVICNGIDVCRTIKTIIKPLSKPSDNATSYLGVLDRKEITVILSGFIGRIDNYAKARLGEEIMRIWEDTIKINTKEGE
jgi:uracil-DNA glycosylase family 4